MKLDRAWTLVKDLLWFVRWEAGKAYRWIREPLSPYADDPPRADPNWVFVWALAMADVTGFAIAVFCFATGLDGWASAILAVSIVLAFMIRNLVRR